MEAVLSEMAAHEALAALPSANFVELQTLLKKEALFAAAEKAQIRDLLVDINSLSHEAMQALWRYRRKAAASYYFSHNQLSWSDWKTEVEFLAEHPKPNFIEAHQVFQSSVSAYQDVLRALFRQPQLVAQCLFSAASAHGDHRTRDFERVVRLFLFNLFGNHFLPQEERSLMQLLETIMTLQLASDPKPAYFLRSSSLFTRVFMIYTGQCNHLTTTYLTRALREPIMAVLADDDLDLEVEPTLVWSRLSEDARVEFFGSDHGSIPLDTRSLVRNPGFKKLLDGIYDHLLGFCRQIIANLTKSLFVLPYAIRFVAFRVSEELASRQCTPQEIRAALGDLLFARFIGPAIASPATHGIITDTPVTPEARRNLSLIAKVLRDVSRGSFSSPNEHFMAPLYERLQQLGDVDISAFFEKIISVPNPDQALGFPAHSVSHRGRKHNVFYSLEELAILQDFLGMFVEGLGQRSISDAFAKLQPIAKLKELQHGEFHDAELVFTLADSEEAGGLLSERAVMALEFEKQQDIDPSSPIEQAARKLRKALCGMAFNSQHRCLTLVELIEFEHTEAEILNDHTTRVIFHEALRFLQRLPSEALANGGQQLLDVMRRNYEARRAYISYIVSSRQSLLITCGELRQATKLLEHASSVHDRTFLMMKVHMFMTKYEQEVGEFVQTFGTIDLLDEKGAFVTQFTETMSDNLANDPAWRDVPETELEDGCLLLEKRCISFIYRSAFFPHDSDAIKDQVFHDHIGTNLSYMTPQHSALQIKESHLGEAPWPEAQKQLLRLNAYKSPGDKVHCVMDCCNTIMDLVQIAGQSASADDFFPILVFVILQANPPNLLSTIQFVKYFGEAVTSAGEGSYWWAQFCSAVYFIQSIDDRQDSSKPPSPTKLASTSDL
eukprot:m.63829 g.63829  ORF g.63829 m.63829 type:complete len:893 (+) comp7484_c0_seq1:1995-4673(+)